MFCIKYRNGIEEKLQICIKKDINQIMKSKVTIEAPLINLLIDKKFSIHRRSILFLLVLCVFLVELWGSFQSEKDGFRNAWILHIGLTIAVFAPICLNMFVLIPYYLFNNKYIKYLSYLTICIIFFYVILLFFVWIWWPNVNTGSEEPPQRESLFFSGILYFIIIGILCAGATAFKLFQQWVKDHYRIIQLENNLIHAELDLLKANISPHFLFNMLNNIEVLIKTEPTKARRILLEFSEFLRYQLYDSGKRTVLLSADIKFLNNFLSLEKIRRDHFEFEIQEFGTQRQLEVSPLIFIPFVENAVKHNLTTSTAFVKIVFRVSENQIIFICENPMTDQRKENVPDGGFGLPNVQRRLHLLYPNRHELTIVEKKGLYSVTLMLNL